MKIATNNLALVFKNRSLEKVLTEGQYAWSLTGKIEVVDTTEVYFPEVPLATLMRHEQLAQLATPVEVADNELVVIFRDGKLYKVLNKGAALLFNQVHQYTVKVLNLSEVVLDVEFWRPYVSNALMAPYIKTITVAETEAALLLVDGKFVKELSTGAHYFLNSQVSVAVLKADLRNQVLDISGQEMLTRDKFTLRLNFQAVYRVNNAITALLQNKDYERQLYIALQLVIRQFVGANTLDELLEKKDVSAAYVKEAMADTCEKLGLTLVDCGMRDVILPGDMKDILNQVLVAEKKAQANTIMRREETAATRSLLNTAKLMEDNEMLLRMKEMEVMERVAGKVQQITLNGGNQLMEQLKVLLIGNAEKNN